MTVKELIVLLKAVPEDYYLNAFGETIGSTFDILSIGVDHDMGVVFIDIEN